MENLVKLFSVSMPLEQLKNECIENKVDLTSTKEHVRWVKNGNDVWIETESDYFKFNGGASTLMSELNIFVPYQVFVQGRRKF